MNYNLTKLHDELKSAGLKIHGVSGDGRIDWITPPTPEQTATADAVLKSHVCDDPKWEQIRSLRNALLAACDWTMVSDTPLAGDYLKALKVYRQALRDIPQMYSKSDDVVFPEPPKK